MFTPSRYLGVDVSKDTLAVACDGQHWKFANSKEGHRKFIAQLKKLGQPVHVVCEATGPYHLAMGLALQEAGLPVSICNGARIRYFGLSEGKLAKNDPADASLIERFANAKHPAPTAPLCRELLALNELLTHRSQLVEMRKVLRTHEQQIGDAAVRAENRKSMASLERRIESIDQRLRQKVEAHPAWKRTCDLLTTVKGVGFTTALVLLVKMPELGSLNRGQCAALAGLAPYDDDSGKHSGRRSIRGGRRDVRTALYMAAAAAARFNPVLRPFHERLIAQKKPYKVAITAVMRKLLLYLNTLLKAPAVTVAA